VAIITARAEVTSDMEIDCYYCELQ